MIELKSQKQLKRAIERAQREARNLTVRHTSSMRQYRVTNSVNGNTYLVNFYIGEGGKRYGDCTCMAGQNGMPCKHVADAAALNMYLAGLGMLKGAAYA